MEVNILHLIDGAKQAKGLTVIIDVFRAFTVEAWCFARGAEKVIPVADIETAFAYKREHPDALLCGERGGKMVEGFDFGNSPSQFEHADLTGKTVVHTTSAGTQGIANATGADEILGGSLVSAKAIAAYIRKKNPEYVSLVCMGLAGETRTDEDTLCGIYIKSLLMGNPTPTFQHQLNRIKYTDGAKFLDPAQQDVFPERDFHLSLATDTFDFIVRLNRDAELPYMEKVESLWEDPVVEETKVAPGDMISKFTDWELYALPNEVKANIAYGHYTEPTGNFDAALVLGGNPDVMKSRAEAAAKLYHEGRCKLFIPTGGVAWETEFGFITESQTLRKYLVDFGVPEEAIVCEDKATTTVENMRNVKEIMDARIPSQRPRVAVVTSYFHIRRSVALARHYLPHAEHVGVRAYAPLDNPREFFRDAMLAGRINTECRCTCVNVKKGITQDFKIM